LLLLTGYASAQPPTLTLTLLCEGLADPNGLVIGGGSVLYGTTNAGGGIDQAYSLTPPVSPGAPWTYTVLHNFAGADGALPTGVLAIGRGGGLYGGPHLGGGGNCYPEGCGVGYALIPPASSGGTWSFRVPYRFMTAASSRPAGVVVGALRIPNLRSWHLVLVDPAGVSRRGVDLRSALQLHRRQRRGGAPHRVR